MTKTVFHSFEQIVCGLNAHVIIDNKTYVTTKQYKSPYSFL